MDRFQQAYEQYRNNSNVNELNEKGENSSSPNQEKIVAVRRNDDGDLIAFQTESGRQLDYLEALSEAKSGKIAHVDVFHRYGRDMLRSEPDGISENNLNVLPDF